MSTKIRVIESKGARKLVLMNREDFEWLVECATKLGYPPDVKFVGGQLLTVADAEWPLLAEPKE